MYSEKLDKVESSTVIGIKPEGKSIEPTEEALVAARDFYDHYHSHRDGGIRLGLFDEDLDKAVLNPESVLVEYEHSTGQTLYAPLLVPVHGLEWYNSELLQEVYGSDTPVYCYAHPPLSNDEGMQIITGEIKRILDTGAVIIFDEYEYDDKASIIDQISTWLGAEYTVEEVGKTDQERSVDIYVGKVDVNNGGKVTTAPSIKEVYDQAIAEGAVTEDLLNGVSVANVIVGEEAERIWAIYENPFNELGEADPVYAGFDKEHLMQVLADPETAKVVNRVNGEITTLCFFVQNFDRCPWFNKQYYKDNYPEYFKTNNILMFPGIVSDENKRGNHYAQAVIDLTTNMLARRGSDFLVTFECTQISTTYIPEIVEAAVNDSGVATIQGLSEPASTMYYKVMRKNLPIEA